MSLMFETERDAHKFLNGLIEHNIARTSLLKGRLDISKEVTEITSIEKGVYVHRDDYKFEDSDSPSNTWDEVKSPSDVTITFDPIQLMRSLEDISQLPVGDTLYKCTSRPKSFILSISETRTT